MYSLQVAVGRFRSWPRHCAGKTHVWLPSSLRWPGRPPSVESRTLRLTGGCSGGGHRAAVHGAGPASHTCLPPRALTASPSALRRLPQANPQKAWQSPGARQGPSLPRNPHLRLSNMLLASPALGKVMNTVCRCPHLHPPCPFPPGWCPLSHTHRARSRWHPASPAQQTFLPGTI